MITWPKIMETGTWKTTLRSADFASRLTSWLAFGITEYDEVIALVDRNDTMNRLALLGLAAVLIGSVHGNPPQALAADEPAAAANEPWLQPYTGPTRTDVDATTLDGKVLCGYQGWFNTPGDGTNFGFTHWGQGLNRPDGGRFTVDMWPDVSEYDPQDLCEVPGLKMPDGSPARLYSAFRKGPVLLHCKWMRQYGIDGVFLSRFVGEAASPTRPATSTWCWPTCGRDATARGGSGR